MNSSEEYGKSHLIHKYLDFLTSFINELDFSEEMDDFCQENDVSDEDRLELESLPLAVIDLDEDDEDDELSYDDLYGEQDE